MPSRFLAALFIAAATAILTAMSAFADDDQPQIQCLPDVGCSGIPGVFDELDDAAAQADVQRSDLLGALNTIERDTGRQVRPKQYLYSTGQLWPPYEPPPAKVVGTPSSPVIECIIWRESRGDPHAQNASGHKGLGQFADATWDSTPQGKAGKSVYDPVANRQAIAWMLQQGRGSEFTSGCT